MNYINDLFSDVMNFEAWMMQLFIIVILILLLTFIQQKIILRIQRRVTKTHNGWDDAFFNAVSKPLTLLVWIIGLSVAAGSTPLEDNAHLFKLIKPVREIGVIYCLAWFLFRFIKSIENNLIARSEQGDEKVADKTTIQVVARLVRLSFVITAGLVTLQTLGFSISGVLAFGGVGGIAVGFAARDLLANFFGGLTVYLDRPFVVGDWIRSPDRRIEGTVESIGWRLSCVRTFDKRPLYIPNSIFTNIIVENASRMSHRRIKETIGIRYDDLGKLSVIVKEIRQMLIDHEGIDNLQTLIVNFDNFGASTLDFFIYAFTKTTNWIEFHSIKEDVLLRAASIIEKHGAQIANRTTIVHRHPEAAS